MATARHVVPRQLVELQHAMPTNTVVMRVVVFVHRWMAFARRKFATMRDVPYEACSENSYVVPKLPSFRKLKASSVGEFTYFANS